MNETFTLADGTVVHAADFEFGFTLDGKAQTETQDDGSVLIEGYAADFGLDRQEEAFEPGAFEQGVKSYMDTNPVLLYHHKFDTALGKILDAKVDNQGLYVKALVDAPEPGTQVADYVRKIKNGVIKGFSVGGKFYRRATAGGQRIFKCDLREISCTPLPVNPRTLFAVAGKAFDNKDFDVKATDNPELQRLEDALGRVDAALSAAESAKLEGKAQHPDGPAIAALAYHIQKVHTLAENTKQNTDDPEVEKVASAAQADMEKHHAAIHKLIAKVGPVSESYGGTVL
jgi:HK97 family phage prohead protease